MPRISESRAQATPPAFRDALLDMARSAHRVNHDALMSFHG